MDQKLLKENTELLLESASGFMMPFVPRDDEQVEMTLGYGEQRHPISGETFHHSGVDYNCRSLPLYALASGTVIAVGDDKVHGRVLVIRYGKYDVRYGHISRVAVSYGDHVVAGQPVAVSGDFLHIGVVFDGREVNPLEFLSVICSNMATLESMGIKGHPQLIEYDVPVRNSYEPDQAHITDMFLRYFPEYVQSLTDGRYRPLSRTSDSLADLFRQAGERSYFFETLPSLGNPLGLSERSAPLVGKIQDLLIGDFLAFMAQRHQRFVPTWTDEQKKSLLMKFQPSMASSIP